MSSLAAVFLLAVSPLGLSMPAAWAADTSGGASWGCQAASLATLKLIDPATNLQSSQAGSSTRAVSAFVPKWQRPPGANGTGFASSSVRQASVQSPIEARPSDAVHYEHVGPTPADEPTAIEHESPVPWDQFDGYQSSPVMGDGCATGDCGMDPGWSGCGDFCSPCAGPCWPCWRPFHDRLWVRGDYLLWWTKGFEVPPLVTTGDEEQDLGIAGALGQPGTRILFGNERLNNEARSGGRINFGYWLDPCKLAALEATYFGLEDESTLFHTDQNDEDVLSRPFYNLRSVRPTFPNIGEAAYPVVYPVEAPQGRIDISAETELHSAEGLIRRNLYMGCGSRLDLVAGYRFARLNDDLAIHQFTETSGLGLSIDDLFSTRNTFNGGQLGLIAEVRRCRWTLEMLAKLALGGTYSEVTIDGSTSVEPPGTFSDEGFLARPSNIGTHSQEEFTVIPELGVTLGYDLTCRLRFMFGYTFLYWSKVARPGDQIDLSMELADPFPFPQADEAVHPRFPFATTDFWAQGLSFGFDYRF